jgi:hypothetical protein
MNKNKNKALINITDPIFIDLAPENSFLKHCINNSKWDDENDNTASLAHYNTRLAVSKILKIVEINDDDARPLIKLLTSQSQQLNEKDIIQGFKAIEIISKKSMLLKQAKTYSTAFRSFVSTYSSPISNGLNVHELPYKSILIENSTFEKNDDIDLFKIQVKGSRKIVTFVDPDLFPTLFKKDSVLHHMMLNIESNYQQKTMEYSVIAGLRSQLNDISKWPDFSDIKELLNQPLQNVQADSIKKALVDYEKRIYAEHPDKKLHQVSTTFRQHLFTYGLTAPELYKEKNNFTPNFHRSGNLKFKPNFTIKAKGSDYNIDGFELPSILPIGGVGEHCLNQLEVKTKREPIEVSDITKLLEILMIIEQEDYTNARLLLARKPQDLVTFYVNNGLKDIEGIIIEIFPSQKLERISIIRDFLSLCDIPTKNGKLIRELEIESIITPKKKVNTLPLGTYSKTNGKKKHLDYGFNLSKLKELIKPNSTLSTALNGLKIASSKTPVPSSTLSIIELTLGHIVDTNNDANLIKHVLVNPMSELSQRDFRVGFAQLEDIIDEHDFNVKAARSQALRSFLSKYAGKINGQIEIKNCGFSSRFNTSSENNAQKLIEPVDEYGQPLPSPVLDKHLSLHELKKKIHEYLEKPINQILGTCIEEIANYNKLVTCFSKYTAIDQSGNYSYEIPEEVTSIVLDNQIGNDKQLKRSRLAPIREKYSSEVLMGAYVRHQISLGPSSTTNCLEKSALIPEYVQHFFSNTGTGMRNFFWCSVFLPKNILLVCFIRLIIRTTWNKDVIATLARSNLPSTLPDGPFKISGFKEKVGKNTSEVTIEPHEKEIREVISFLIQHNDNMVSYGLKPECIWDTPNSSKLNFLSATIIDRLSEHYNLPYFRMELLAKHQINLRKGIDGDVLTSQMERNHGSIRVTSGYLTHPIAEIEYEANNADFQRRFETTVQFRHEQESIEKYGLDKKNIDTNLIIAPGDHKEDLPEWFVLPDGSSCTDIFASVDKSKSDNICKGRKCHSGEGCDFNRIDLGVEDFIQTLRNQAYYMSRGEALLNRHGKEYFDEYIAPDMRFSFGLVKYVELANPVLFKEAKGRLANVE